MGTRLLLLRFVTHEVIEVGYLQVVLEIEL